MDSANTQHPETDDAENIITLLGDNGEQQQFELLDIIEVEGREYALLLPFDATGDADGEGEGDASDGNGDEEVGVVVLRFEADETLTHIDDEEEFQRVVAALENMSDEDEDEDA
ncbi:MAG: DUF1292 domain-containing protein [Candidatus Sericytochromatia bacterium]|nr:DUF1292 domain-containing protein [Candidatus Tanganyikabacteria bacterium]